MTRLYLPQPLVEGQTVELPPATARHAVQVLRLAAGAMLTVFNGEGGEYDAVLERAERRAAIARVGAWYAIERESPLALTLAQCVSKGERMDYTIQKAVELGVQCLVPLLSERSVVKLDAGRWEKKQAHWQGVIVAACEQCGRNHLPRLAPVTRLTDWLGSSAGLRLVLAPGAAEPLHTLPSPSSATLLAGPEGGLSDAEIGLAGEHGCRVIRLGPRVLRTETAGVAAVAVMQALWGDLACA